MDCQQAIALYHAGRVEEATRAYELILHDDPTNAAALNQLGSLRLVQGNAAAAESLLRQAIDVSPTFAEAHANLAALLQRQDRSEEAKRHYERALALAPSLVETRFAFSVSLQMSGHAEQALACYQQLLQLQPDHVEANFGVGLLLAQLGRTEDAIWHLRAALAADPDFAEASYELGRQVAWGSNAEDAIACFRRALEVDPDYVAARLALAETLSRFRHDDPALAEFQHVLAAEPDEPSAHVGLGLLLDRRWQHIEARAHYDHVLARDPMHAEALAALANNLRQAGAHTEALAIARRLVAHRPDWFAAAHVLSRVLAELGMLDEAEAESRRAVNLAPDRPELLYHLTQVSPVRPGDGTIPRLEAAAARISSYSNVDQYFLHFALAKAYCDMGAHSRGFAHTLQGNAIVRSNLDYVEAARLGYMDRIRDVFDSVMISVRRGQGAPSDLPVFIVGMPRSGTTLVEQILASHSRVFAAGERSELETLLLQAGGPQTNASGFPEAVRAMSAQQLHDLGTAYLAALRSLAPHAARITDKAPNNFHYLGMIRCILPNARIIHVMRDPVDTCLSCFATYFGETQPFSYDLTELGRYYRAYRQLMAHWRTVLPLGAVLDVRYEQLIDDFAEQARRIISYCGLDWQPTCLEFYKTPRPIATASVTQVRQPIYRSSIGRWRPDPAALRPMMAALGEMTDPGEDR